MDDTQSTPGQDPDLDAGQVDDQDAEPTMNAPQEDRPDGLDALDDDESDTTGGDGSPS
jgi:hypothetical protein